MTNLPPVIKIVPMPGIAGIQGTQGLQGVQGPAGGSGSADIADFIFTDNEYDSSITLPGDKGMRIEAGIDSDLYLTAGDDLYIQTLGEGDDIHLNAADDIRFTANNEDSAFAQPPAWRMDSEGLFQLPGNGYISNPYTETTTSQTYTVSFNDNYLSNQSGLNQAYSVALTVGQDSLWFVNNYTITSPVTITFADSTTTTTIAIYDATSQGTPAVIFQWDDQERNKTYADTFPLTISAQYDQVSYGTSTIELDPESYGNDQKIVIDATTPNHIHVRAGGDIDESTADLFLGGERNHVLVSDGGRSVSISTKPASINNTYTNMNSGNANYFVVDNTAEIYVGDTGYYSGGGDLFTVDSVTTDSPSAGLQTITATSYGTPMPFAAGGSYVFIHDQSWNNGWIFDTNGTLSGPAMGSVIVNGLTAVSGQDLAFYSSDQDIKLYTESVSDMPVGYRYPAIKNVTNDDSPPFSVNDILPASLLDMGRTLWNDYPETVVYYEIPLDSTLNFPLGAEIKFACGGISAFFIISEDNDVVTVIGEGDNYNHSLSGTNYFILPPDRIATLTKLASNRWIFSGFGVTD